MSLFDLIETKFTEVNSKMQVIDPTTGKPDPTEVTIPRQGMINGLLKITGWVRTLVTYSYAIYILGLYLAIKIKLVKAPEFKSAIPGNRPSK